MHKLNQKGFTTIEAVLILVVVAIIGGTGFYVYNANKKSDDTYSAASKSAQSTPEKVSKKPVQKSLDIKEWGVKIPLSSAVDGAYYKQDDTDKTNPPTYLKVFATQADSITGTNGVSCKGAVVAQLSRLSKGDPVIDEPTEKTAESAYKIIGDYYYRVSAIRGYGIDCENKGVTGNFEQNTEVSLKIKAISDAFVADFKGLQVQ